MNNDEEIWKDVIGYEDLYQVSNHGNVKSFHKYTKGKLLNPSINGSGYFHISLCKNNKRKLFRIHRLVALYFIHNPKNKPQVNHKDGNKLNNHVSNLEWVTRRQNIQHAWKLGLCENTRNTVSKIGKMNSKKVKCIELDKIFNSAMDAERQFGINNSNISKCCKGFVKSAGKKIINGKLTKLTWKYIQ